MTRDLGAVPNCILYRSMYRDYHAYGEELRLCRTCDAKHLAWHAAENSDCSGRENHLPQQQPYWYLRLGQYGPGVEGEK